MIIAELIEGRKSGDRCELSAFNEEKYWVNNKSIIDNKSIIITIRGIQTWNI